MTEINKDIDTPSGSPYRDQGKIETDEELPWIIEIIGNIRGFHQNCKPDIFFTRKKP